MPEFDHNAAYIWTLVSLGIGLPVLLAAYVHVRARLAKQRLAHLQADERVSPRAPPRP